MLRVHLAIRAHLERVEAENDLEHFQSVPRGTMAELYSPENLRKPVGVPGWARLWLDHDDQGSVIAHASAYDAGEPGFAMGHVSTEGPHRRKGIAAKLHSARAAWLDRHGLTLVGAIVPGNDVSMRSHLANGCEVLRVDEETGATWLARFPRGQKSDADR